MVDAIVHVKTSNSHSWYSAQSKGQDDLHSYMSD